MNAKGVEEQRPIRHRTIAIELRLVGTMPPSLSGQAAAFGGDDGGALGGFPDLPTVAVSPGSISDNIHHRRCIDACR